MFDVSRGEHCSARDCNPGNLSIAQVNVASRFLASAGQCSRLVCSGAVKVDDSVVEILLHQTNERCFQSLLAFAFREQGDAKARLKQRDTRNPNRLRRLPIEPTHDTFLRLVTHERRDHIRIENDQPSSAGCGRCPRNSGKSDLSPIWRNRAAMRVPSPAAGRLSSLAALRKISRTSASMLRPWRSARRCRRTLTSSSNCRTITCAMASPK